VLLAGAAGAVVLALAAGCGDDNSGDMPGMGHGHGSGATATSTAPGSGAAFTDADITFAQNMIPHHKQAVQMADLAASGAADPEIKQLAGQIKAAQDPEIKTLTGWLTAWGKPIEPPQGHGGHAMPGMMSDAEMGKLTWATGTGFDRRRTDWSGHPTAAVPLAAGPRQPTPRTHGLRGAEVSSRRR
jgi:uncharacterized protein (DUF305 family)